MPSVVCTTGDSARAVSIARAMALLMFDTRSRIRLAQKDQSKTEIRDIGKKHE
jgi:uncharacterized protein YjiS (DUF1127 family)